MYSDVLWFQGKSNKLVARLKDYDYDYDCELQRKKSHFLVNEWLLQLLLSKQSKRINDNEKFESLMLYVMNKVICNALLFEQ
jgi:hypothetical protein